MKRSLVAGLALLALVAAPPAAAADLPRADAVQGARAYVTSYNWTGFYLGLNAGYGFGQLRLERPRVSTPVGRLHRRHVGYNWQAAGSPWVFGLEVDSALGQLQGHRYLRRAGLRVLEQLARHRARPSATRSTAPWCTSPAASRSATSKSTHRLRGRPTDTNRRRTVGAGVEQAFSPNWTGKIEYIYSTYSTDAAPPPAASRPTPTRTRSGSA